jgi:hypothetical protein
MSPYGFEGQCKPVMLQLGIWKHSNETKFKENQTWYGRETDKRHQGYIEYDCRSVMTSESALPAYIYQRLIVRALQDFQDFQYIPFATESYVTTRLRTNLCMLENLQFGTGMRLAALGLSKIDWLRDESTGINVQDVNKELKSPTRPTAARAFVYKKVKNVTPLQQYIPESGAWTWSRVFALPYGIYLLQVILNMSCAKHAV